MAEAASGRKAFWRALAARTGWQHGADLPPLLWPMLWASWFAAGGRPAWAALLALTLAILLARSAAWAGYEPLARSLVPLLRERRPLLLLLLLATFCFALPLGWAGLLIPATLIIAGGWFVLRPRSYLADPVLAVSPLLPASAAWLIQDPTPDKSTGLLLLAAGLWCMAVLLTTPPVRPGAALARLAGERAALAAALLKLLAVVSLVLAGRQAQLGIFFHLGLVTAACLTLYQWATASRGVARPVLETWWGAAIFCGLAFHFLCTCAAPTPAPM